MQKKPNFLSRRTTPWDNYTQRSTMGNFIRDNFIDDYNEHYPDLNLTNESSIINYYVPEKCPYRGSF